MTRVRAEADKRTNMKLSESVSAIVAQTKERSRTLSIGLSDHAVLSAVSSSFGTALEANRSLAMTKAKKVSSAERKLRSRERNRVHAQRTRQRKKEQMQTLQKQAAELKEEQIRLKQTINEKNTATILVKLFAEGTAGDESMDDDPAVEALLRKTAEEIPDATKIPELPSLILPGQHASKKMKAAKPLSNRDLPLDGIDYELLGKDRSQCTPEELDKIRRERNRMHAKRTRDRKRLFTEKMAEICRQLEDENLLLHRHLQKLDPGYKFDIPLRPKVCLKRKAKCISKPSNIFDQQISTLLKAASHTDTLHEVSDTSSAGEDESVTKHPRRFELDSKSPLSPEVKPREEKPEVTPPLKPREDKPEVKHGFQLPTSSSLPLASGTVASLADNLQQSSFFIVDKLKGSSSAEPPKNLFLPSNTMSSFGSPSSPTSSQSPVR